MNQQQTTRPSQIDLAQEQVRLAQTRIHLARSNRAERDAFEDLEFWSNKSAMLQAMVAKGMAA